MEFEAIFKALDKDSSGEIDIQELNDYVKQHNLPQEFVERWQKTFDLDKNGTVSLAEFRQVLGISPRRDYLAFFTKADPEGKGVVKVTTLKKVFSEESAEEVFDMYFKDCPDDGEIKVDEFKLKMEL
ncbi:hypothetical protein BOX15_Mlig011854g2 [Macrostomum lignano]|uniref:EF-hand domain-containing protein n=2 Tax=Macrostomum lignano TaxID=282301 RepID=A0A1I8GKM7_9PLAT|nr:hypothetical protein BOX15_Mlig011854g1 [Macrostomum lignano]PAA91294.1 hypothetical protein BOX15_Mlig011854g2 [Macrostomum lignano]